jgi:DNA mismatch repair protein MutH
MINKHSNKDEILAQAEYLHGKTLRDIINIDEIDEVERIVQAKQGSEKGLFGNLTEFYGFNLKQNNIPEPDFQDAGIELKTTGIKISEKKKLWSAKERLSFSMINYNEVYKESWENSSFLSKNQRLLIMFYLYIEIGKELDRKIMFHKFLDLLDKQSSVDIVQIENDWNCIINKINLGLAHELSGGDTAYLEAATKGKNSSVTTTQPFSDIPAKPRAFALKQAYFTSIVKQFQNEKSADESLFKDPKEPTSIEDYIKIKLTPHYGKTEEELANQLGIIISKPNKQKQLRRQIIDKILGLKGGRTKVVEFIKSSTTLKVIKLEENGRLVESISFPIFKYLDLVEQEWLESDFYNDLTSGRFLFVVYRKKGNTSILEQFKFWTFPESQIEFAESFWKRVVRRVKDCKADDLPGLADNDIMHVRPHTTKGTTNITPCGNEVRTQSFWLNNTYIRSIFN